MQKVYISSTYKDFREYRSTLISLFHKQLKGKFELCEIMEHMFDDGSSSTYVEECVAAVKECDIYFIILGNSVGSYPPDESRTYTEIEYQTAMEEDKFIYRLQLENIDPKSIDDPAKHKALRDSFEGKHVTYFNDEAELEGIFLKSLLNHFKEINTDNPYIGSDPFKIEEGGYYFGREEEIEKFIKLLLTTEKKRVFSVVGDSGVGKSSFISAGVMHRMLEEEVMGFSEHIPLVLRPGDQPLTNLKYMLRRHVGIHGQDLSAKDFEGAKILLFIDHLEELLTQNRSTASEQEVSAFVRLMNELATHPNLDLVVFLSVRSDMAESLSQFAFVGNHSKEFEIKSFDFKKNDSRWEQAITDIITAPAAKHGVSLETELVSSLVKELEQLDGALPVLQMTLYQLWDPKVIKDHQIKYSELLKLSGGKGLVGLLRNHANAVTSRITDKGKNKLRENILKSMLLNLVEVSEEHGDLKRNLSKKKLFEKLDHYPNQEVESVFEDLISQKSRLLLVSGRELDCEPSENDSEGSCVTLIHRGLIRKWPQLQQWIEERRDALKMQKRLMSDVRDYEENKGSLYRGKRLGNALRWQKNNKDFWDHSIQRFLKKSKIGQLVIFSIPFLLGMLFTMFYFLAFRPYIQRDHFLSKVVNARPEILKNFLDAGASLTKPQTLSLASGTLDELNSEYSIQRSFPLKKNLRYFGEVNGLQLMNNSTIDSFLKLKQEMEEHSAFASFQASLDTLSLVHLSKLASLEGIHSLDHLKSLVLKENLRLDLPKDLKLPDSLTYLEVWDNDGIRHLPRLDQLNSLKSIVLVGNDELSKMDEGLPAQLENLLISGNSLLEEISGLEKAAQLRTLTVDYNDNLKALSGIQELKGLESLVIEKNPNLNSIEPLAGLDQLVHLKMGISKLLTLPALPVQLEDLVLDANVNVSRMDFRHLKQLSTVEIQNNTRLKTLRLPAELHSIKISNNDSLAILQVTGNSNLQKLHIAKSPKLKSIQENILGPKTNHVVLDSIPWLESLQFLSPGKQSIDSLVMSEVGGYWFTDGLERVADLQALKYFKVHGENFLFNFDVPDDDVGKDYRALEELVFFKHYTPHAPADYFSGPFIKGIPSLEKLSYQNNPSLNYVEGIELENLKELRFVKNPHLRELPNLANLPGLEVLVIENNDRLEELPDFSTSLQLKLLRIKNNRLIADYSEIGRLSGLEVLELDSIDLYLNDLNFVKKLTRLQEVNLIKNKSLTDVSGLDSSAQLKTLRIIDNYRLSSIPDLQTLANLHHLEVVSNTNLIEIPKLSNALLEQLSTLIFYANNEIEWDQDLLEKLDWSHSNLTHLELDTKTFKKLFIESGLLKESKYLSNSKTPLDKLIIHIQPNEDLRELNLVKIKQKNSGLSVELKLPKKKKG